MPLFVFLSGYFSKKMDTKKYVWFIIRTLETLALFQTVCVLMKYMGGQKVTLGLIISPYSVYWYLLSLILWRSIIQMIPVKWLEYKITVLIVCCIIGLMAGFLPISNEMALQRTFAFLPFFFLGYYSYQNGWLDSVRRLPKLMSIFILCLTICLFYFVYHYNILSWTRLCENMPYLELEDLVARFLIWILALGNGAFFVRFSKSSKVAALLGSYTLYIFVYHQFFIEILVKYAKLIVPHSITVIVIESIIVVFICSLIAIIPFFRNIVNPVTSLIEKKRTD